MEIGSVMALNTKENPKMEKIHKMKLAGGGSMSSVRKRLGDITNLNQSESVFKPMIDHGNPSPNVIPSLSARDYNQLLTENTSLTRMLAEKTEIIEHNNLEIQKLRRDFQKSQQQNWQLARAHSQMLTELNLGKDRLKLLQHELSCTLATLKAKSLKLEEKENKSQLLCEKVNIEKNKSRNCDKITGDESYLPANEKPSAPNRKRSSKNISLCAFNTALQATTATTEMDLYKCTRPTRVRSSSLRPQACESELPTSSNCPENREQTNERRSTQRQTNTLKTQVHGFQLPVNTENIADEDQPILPGTAGFSSPHPLSNEADEEHQATEEKYVEIKAEVEELSDNRTDSALDVKRSSIARPSRRATIGVSYKELPLNIKMRRSS